ncbi:unnamed protein product [Rotaria sordida]|uniref:Uncharacterized protein n=1 Tax=Rotaria sordida TaxID=392033 RepID=A0A814SWF6_9BILA|nr:unnamed protein product [Rotaria sordida]CAF3875919.1 unnamed protein product [Rotaria sordida]
MSKNRLNEEEKVEEKNTYKRICNKHRQAKRRERLTNLFVSNDLSFNDPSIMCLENFDVSEYEENIDHDTFNYLSDMCIQDIIPPDDEDNNNNIDTNNIDNDFYLIDIGNDTIDNEFEDFNDDNNWENNQSDDVIIDPIFESVNNETEIELEIGKYICQSNLDKINTNRLLNLLNQVHDRQTSPPLSIISLWNKLNYKLKQHGNEDDIVRGELYKKQSGKSSNPITLLLSSDGKPTIKSSSCSIWPVLASIIEIPRPYRDNKQNMILLCLWHSPRSPSAEQLLGHITTDLSRLITTGIDIEINSLGFIHFDVFVQGVCADAPGQSKITQMVAHNGYYGCRVCEYEGSYSAVDNTCIYSWSSFERIHPSFRTRDRFELCLQEVEHLKTMHKKNINVRGIKGISPLNHLIFIPTQAIYDYFHLCLEGHTIVLLKEWNDMHYGSSVQTREIIDKFDEFLSSINYPHSINRRVRNLRSFNDWKAAQLRIFLLYLALPFLLFFRDYFPPLLVYHFSLYSIYIRTLCKFNEQKHVMFGSESCLHGLYKLAHGTKHIGQQIAYWYTVHRAIHSMSIEKQLDISDHGNFMDGYIDELIIKKYKQQFDHAFFLKFSCLSDESVVFRSRYKIGLIVDQHLSMWSERVNSFYFLVDKDIDNFFIFPCTALRSKCFFFPFRDDRFVVCTPIDNELEHD